MNDKTYLDNIMMNGKNQAVAEADSVLKIVYDILGLANP